MCISIYTRILKSVSIKKFQCSAILINVIWYIWVAWATYLPQATCQTEGMSIVYLSRVTDIVNMLT